MPTPQPPLPLERTTGPHTFYVYRDAQGLEHIVNHVEAVPAPYRDHAKVWVMELRKTSDLSDLKQDVGQVPSELAGQLAETAERMGIQLPATLPPGFGHLPGLTASSSASSEESLGGTTNVIEESAPASTSLLPALPFDPSSFILGVGMAAAVAMILLVRKRAGFFAKALLLIVIAAVASTAYMGWIRRQAGFSDASLAQPGSVVDDARGVVQQLEERMQQEQRALDQLEELED